MGQSDKTKDRSANGAVVPGAPSVIAGGGIGEDGRARREGDAGSEAVRADGARASKMLATKIHARGGGNEAHDGGSPVGTDQGAAVSDDSGKLVYRAVARRPLKEMLRCRSDSTPLAWLCYSS